MSKAIITFEDEGDQVKVSIEFGEEGGQETSPAHHMAVMAVQKATEAMGQAGEGEVG